MVRTLGSDKHNKITHYKYLCQNLISYFKELSDELLKLVTRVIVIAIRSTRDRMRELLSRPDISSYSVTLCLT